MTYDIRYCAFVDILGFTSLIDDLNNGRTTVDGLRSVLAEVHKPALNILHFDGGDFKAQSISDAVCISSADNDRGLLHILHSLTALCFGLLVKGYFFRGGIVRGKLYHDDDMVFGDALVRAYRLESGAARFPRIVLPREIAEKAVLFKDHAFGSDFIRQAPDGPFFLHILAGLETLMKGVRGNLYSVHLDRINAAAAAIQRRFDESVDNPQHFEKVKWFANYWNEVVFGLDGTEVTPIFGAGLSSIRAEEDQTPIESVRMFHL